MKLTQIENINEVDKLAGGEFLQSRFWSEILEKGGEEITRWTVEDEGKIRAIITFVKKSLFGRFFYWYAPRGPRGDKAASEYLISQLKKNNKAGVVFLRIEPDILPSAETIKCEIKKSIDLQPKKTLFLDLALGEEKLLAEMHQKTRYNIRLAEKKGVKIIPGSLDDFTDFWRLMSLTGERDGFRLHSAEHYKNLLSASGQIKLFFASYNGKNIATGLFCFFGDRVTYLHGASDNEARNLMSPYLLQWEVIKEAQKNGYKYYDFYGIDEKKWPGVTRFKLGFGGFVKEYPGTHDIIFRPLVYKFYEFLRKLRRMIK
jgi:lipid II:glycine glycyltransferase (peptidoglycan interpeptide bridge formation enzyme)